MKSRFSSVISRVSVLALAIAAHVQAQQQTQSGSEAPAQATKADANQIDEEIIVTGTSIRGVRPTGAQLLGMGEEEIKATGAGTSAQLLANIPQISGFNTTPVILGSNTFNLAVNRPNLRTLPRPNSNGGNGTLLLMDGHRLPGAGIIQTTPDADVVPPSIIQRVEVVPDGGSSIYGSDAIGGVINYITRKDFDGLEIGTRYGVAEDYWTTNTNVTYGTNWGGGSAYVAYNFSKHDEIYGSDRGYVKRLDWSTGIPNDRTCNPGNVRIGTTTYALPGLVANTANVCDESDAKTMYPAEERHSALVGLSQQIGERVTLDVKAYYTDRSNDSDGGIFRSTVAVSPSNPNYRSTGDANGAATQTVAFNYEPVFGNSTKQETELETWGVAPELTVDLNGNWQLRALLNYGHTTTDVANDDINLPLVSSYVTAGRINPYDVAASDPQALADVVNYQVFGRSEQEIKNARGVVDGALFTLPGGEVRLAVGYEKLKEDYEARAGNTVQYGTGIGTIPPASGLVDRQGQRDIDSWFGEVFLPIVGEGNNFPGVYSLSLSASVRRDEYSDWDDTSNPHYGLEYEPVEWITLHANWGESFQAPSLADTNAPAQVNINTTPLFPSPYPGQEVPPNGVWATITLSGGNPTLQPLLATTYSIGGDIRPPIVEGLEFGITYYNIDYSNQIGRAPIFSPSVFYVSYPDYYVLFPDDATILKHASQVQNGETVVAPYVGPGALPVYSLLDFRSVNLGRSQIDGLDFHASYSFDTSYGSIYTSVSGTYRLSEKSQRAPGLPFDGSTAGEGASRYVTTATIGIQRRNLRAQATWNHVSEYNITNTNSNASNNFQGNVDAFDVVNLFAQYDVNGTGFMENVSVTVNLDNLFDQDPPELHVANNPSSDGYTNGGTLGRLLQVGITKHF